MNDALIGTTLAARYRILYAIAKGGMGAVFEAEDLRSRRRVAVKVIRDEFLRDVVSIERFRREATVSATVRHPSIVATLDVSLDSSPAFFVMELLDGPTVSELLSHADRLPWDRAARVALDVLEGLEALHAAGAIHRDIKPSNVMLVRESGGERAKLIDLGVIRVAPETGEESLTWSGNVVGTPTFMAPEQYAGVSLDARADLYAVGVLLAKMLLGAHSVLRLPLARERSIEGWPADVPPSLAALVESLLRESVDDRPASASQASVSLAQILATHAPRPAPAPQNAAANESSYAGPQTDPARADTARALAQGQSSGAWSPAIAHGSVDARRDPTTSSIVPEPTPSAPSAKRWPAIAAVTSALAIIVTAGALTARSSSVDEDESAAPPASTPPASVTANNVSVHESSAGTRIVPMGNRLTLHYGVPDAANMRAAMMVSLEEPLRRCIDPATHPLGRQVVNTMINVDRDGRMLSLDTTANQTLPEEELCVERAFRAARWPSKPDGYSVQLIALADI
jgi:serine/threonine protein kinase